MWTRGVSRRDVIKTLAAAAGVTGFIFLNRGCEKREDAERLEIAERIYQILDPSKPITTETIQQLNELHEYAKKEGYHDRVTRALEEDYSKGMRGHIMSSLQRDRRTDQNFLEGLNFYVQHYGSVSDYEMFSDTKRRINEMEDGTLKEEANKIWQEFFRKSKEFGHNNSGQESRGR